MYNLNSKELLEKDANFLEGDHNNVPVTITEVKSKTDNGIETISVLYRVDKNHNESGAIHTEGYKLVDNMLWKVRVLALACGMYTKIANKDGIEERHVINGADFSFNDLVGKKLLISTTIWVNETTQRAYTNISKHIEIKKEDEIKSLENDPFMEYQASPDSVLDPNVPPEENVPY